MKFNRYIALVLFAFCMWQPNIYADGSTVRPMLVERSIVKDSAITTAVKAKLVADTRTSGLSIEVVTENKIVTLSGVVASQQEKDAAKEIALSVKGVRSVVNNLEVQS